jgi:hypothetical protein
VADTFDGKTATPVAAASVTNTTRVLGGDTAGTGLVIAITALQQAIARLCADKADARTQLGLGSAAVESASAFDAAGSATAAEAAAIAASLQRASNLSDLASKIAALDTITLKGADIASATTTDLSAATGDYVDITGTTTITGLGTCAAGVERTVRFTGALTLTHNATSLILPGAANITTAANDRAIFRSLGSGNWLCVSYTKASGTAVVTSGGGNVTPVFGGRLTLTSGTPVLTADTTGATTIYYALYTSDQVPIYDGSAFVSTTFTELSLALGTLTSGANYDVFVYLVSTTPTLILGPAWTSDTARGTGAGTTELERVKGIWVNKASISGGPAANRGTYLGTIRTTSTTATGCRFGQATTQTGGQWYIWNAYNRVPVDLVVFDSTATWTYNSATYRQANAAAGNKVEYVAGLSTDPVRASVLCGCNPNALNDGGLLGVGVDSTSATSAKLRNLGLSNTTTVWQLLNAHYSGFPGVGYHALNWLEAVAGNATVTFIGSDGGGTPGMTARIFA